jgi:hypothetical protein
MAKNSIKSIARLPINIKIDKEDLESDEELPISQPPITITKRNRNGRQK